MQSVNVLQPTAPELYPQLQPDFRMQKINEISAALNKEVVGKKYKRAKKFVNWSAAGSSGLSFVFSSASFGSALSVVGLPATIPLGGVGGAFALLSSGLIVASKKLDSKIKKHQEIVTLAIAKRDTVDRLISKTLADNQITDSEFQLIMTEFSQYNVYIFTLFTIYLLYLFIYIFTVYATIKLFASLSAPFFLSDFQPVAIFCKFFRPRRASLFFHKLFNFIIYVYNYWCFFLWGCFNYCFKIYQVVFKNVSRKVRSGHRFYSDGAFLQIINNSITLFTKLRSHT